MFANSEIVLTGSEQVCFNMFVVWMR